MVWGSVLISLFHMWLFSLPSTICWRDRLFSIVYSCLLCHRLNVGAWVCFWTFQSVSLIYVSVLFFFLICCQYHTTGASKPGTDLTLAYVGFVNANMWGLGWAPVWASSTACTVGLGAWLTQSWHLTPVGLVLWKQCLRDIRDNCCPTHGWGGTEGSAEVQSTLCVFPVYFEKLHSGCKVTQQSRLTSKQLQQRNPQWPLSQWECSGPTPLPVGVLRSCLPQTVEQKCSSDTDLRASILTARE